MGRIFARMGSLYAWATPEYLLYKMSLDAILMYYDYGMELKEYESNLLVERLAVGLFGANDPAKERKMKKESNQGPDKKAFYDQYGNQIKRPGMKGGQR